VALIHHEFAYIPTFHPELSTDGTLVISYNVNTAEDPSTLYDRVHDYQPKFVELTPGITVGKISRSPGSSDSSDLWALSDRPPLSHTSSP
jgi:hypothetical protein